MILSHMRGKLTSSTNISMYSNDASSLISDQQSPDSLTSPEAPASLQSSESLQASKPAEPTEAAKPTKAVGRELVPTKQFLSQTKSTFDGQN
jgi:hypothetical protein